MAGPYYVTARISSASTDEVVPFLRRAHENPSRGLTAALAAMIASAPWATTFGLVREAYGSTVRFACGCGELTHVWGESGDTGWSYAEILE